MARVLKTSARELAGIPAGEESLADLRRLAGLDRGDVVPLLDAALPAELGRVTEWKLQALENGRTVTAWLSREALQEIIPALAKIYRVPVRTVRRSWFRSFPEQGYMLRAPRTAGREQGQRRAGSGTWEELTRRQRAYLVACFREDQQAEKRAEGIRAAGRDPGRAAQWRRISFTVRADRRSPAIPGSRAATGGGLARFRRGVDAARVGAAGSGAGERGRGGGVSARVRTTRCGRDDTIGADLRPGRAGGIASRPRTRGSAVGVVVDRVGQSGRGRRAGLAEDALWGRAKFYLGTGYRPGGALSRGFIDCLSDGGDARQEGAYRWVVTAAGRDHIRHHASDYRELYPEIPADAAVERVSGS
ncbi:hypothetical protein GCM10023100_00060 [Actinocorallia cavernae]|uniref:Uncharacterized protein n=2 Tax=Actinocorallia cavernae TaxID=328075 RepID=A0ABP8S6A6_9ACTN